MRRMLAGSAILLAVIAGSGIAQGNPPAKKPAAKAAASGKAIAWGDLVGQWDGTATKMDGTKISLTRVTFSADKTMFLRFPGGKPIPERLITMGGDSIVTEAGPYDSVTRKDHKATTTTTMHVSGSKMTGTFHTKFDDGQTLDGKATADKK